LIIQFLQDTHLESSVLKLSNRLQKWLIIMALKYKCPNL